jgi:hypothetical protein
MTGCPEESASVCDHGVTHLVGNDGAQLKRSSGCAGLFRRKILPLRTVPLAEIMEAACCSKASAPSQRRGKRTPHVSTKVVDAETT